jgi:hypothetical protein
MALIIYQKVEKYKRYFPDYSGYQNRKKIT